jgi:hypothetical protein
MRGRSRELSKEISDGRSLKREFLIIGSVLLAGICMILLIIFLFDKRI